MGNLYLLYPELLLLLVPLLFFYFWRARSPGVGGLARLLILAILALLAAVPLAPLGGLPDGVGPPGGREVGQDDHRQRGRRTWPDARLSSLAS